MKKRMGSDPLATLFQDTREEKPAAKPPKPAARPKPARASQDPATDAAEAKLRADYAAGHATNYHINKDGEILQKILVYFPVSFVRELKKEAVDARLSLSALIRKKLGG